MESQTNKNLKYLKRLRIKKILIKPLLISISIWFLAIVLQATFNLAIEKYIDLGGVGKDLSFEYSNYTIKSDVTIYLLPLGIIFVALAEELFWRGYLLPKQEKKWGKFSWLINGILWGITHIFIYNFWSMIFIFFFIPYIAYKYKNTSITIVIHLLINSLSAINWVNSYLATT